MHDYEFKLVDSSRLIVDILVADIGGDQERFDEMYGLALREKYPLSMRAARVVTFCVFQNMKLLFPHLDTFLDIVESTKIDGVKRSYLKILAELPLPLNEEAEGRMAELAFSLVQNTKEAIAIRAYSIDILLKICENYPELQNELAEVLKAVMPGSSVGLESKCRKILAKLNKGK